MGVEDEINTIHSVFLQGEKLGSDHFFSFDSDVIFSFENSRHNAVYFEGVSAGYSKKCVGLSEKNIEKWMLLLSRNDTKHYLKQALLGLGWSFGVVDFNPSLIDPIKEVDRWRVYDGLGYYYGLFYRRRVIRDRVAPGFIPEEFIPAFFQGFGRSLWYSSKGSVGQLSKSIPLFPEKHLADIWRGVGVAIAFIGFLNQDELNTLGVFSETYIKDLKTGVFLASESDEFAHKERLLMVKTASQLSIDSNNIRSIISNKGHEKTHYYEQIKEITCLV